MPKYTYLLHSGFAYLCQKPLKLISVITVIRIPVVTVVAMVTTFSYLTGFTSASQICASPVNNRYQHVIITHYSIRSSVFLCVFASLNRCY